MAGDWIKIEHSLPNKPEVMQLASLLGVDELQIVGHLVCFWIWCDQNLSRSCPDVNGTKRGLDRVVGRDGFVDAMVTVGWLGVRDDGTITIPNYDHHLSQSAKTRGNDQKKKQRQRILSRSCPDANGTSTGQQGGPEKRREEKSNTLSLYDEPSLVSKLPDWAAPDWVGWMNLIFQKTGQWMPAIQQEAVAMEVMRRGPDKGLADLQFTIKVGAKTLQDASNDYTKPKAPAAAGVGPRGKKEVSF
jgi:hypothetical protein